MKNTLLLIMMASLLSACATAPKPQKNVAAGAINTVQSDVQEAKNYSAQNAQYKAWALSEAELLVKKTKQWATLLQNGQLQEAKLLYPHVRMHFERIEPIAELFDELDPKIDRREADLEVGEAWTGFHAIEKILWTQNTTDGTKMLADALIVDLKALQGRIEGSQIDTKSLIEGAIDLLNEVSVSKITGEEEIFSGTDLYAFLANVEGAEKIFKLLRPILIEKDAAIAYDIDQHFAQVYMVLSKHTNQKGQFVDYKSLNSDEVKALAEAVHKLGEPLAKLGVIL